MSMILKGKCIRLGLPAPKVYDTQKSYIKRLMIMGHKVNTRLCRFIGIANLHSIISSLKKKGVVFVTEHGLAKCPETNEIPPYHVDIIYMTQEQIRHHLKIKPEPTTAK